MGCVVTVVGLAGGAQAAVVDHFTVVQPSSPQTSGVPFQVTVSARAADGSVAVDFSGVVSFSARAQSRGPRLIVSEIDPRLEVIELVNPDAVAIDISNWRLDTFAATRWPEPSAAYLFPPGTLVPGLGVFRVASFGNNAGAYPLFYARRPFYWGVRGPNDPLGVLLRDAEGKVLDLVCVAGFDPSLLSTPGAAMAWTSDSIPNDQQFPIRTYQRRGNLDHNNLLDWTNAVPSLGQLNADLRLPLLRDESSMAVEPASVTLQNGAWTGTIRIFRPALGLILQVDDGDGHPGRSNPFDVDPGAALALQLPAEAFEANAGLVGSGTVAIPQPLATNLAVALVSSAPSEVIVPSSVVIPSGTTSVSFDVTNLDDMLLDGSQQATISASAPDFLDASVTIVNHDNETASLTLSLPATVIESGAVVLGQGSVSVSTPVARPVLVSLASDKPGQLQVPATVLVPTGSNSVKFDLIALDDNLIDGRQTVTVTASVFNWTSATGQVAVLDDETTNLSLAIPSPVIEGSGTLSNVASVSISGVLSSNLLVNLESDLPARLGVPASVVIPAGQTSATFPVMLPDDPATNGSSTITVTASALNWRLAQRFVSVQDNDVHHFAFAPLPPAQTAGQPFSVTIYARAIDDTPVTRFSGSVNLELTGINGTLPPVPAAAGPFTNGAWSGNISIPSENRSARLIARSQTGQIGTSDAFDVVVARVLRLAVSDLVYYPGSGKILAGVLSNATAFSQSIVEIDPSSGQVGNPVALGDEPGKLALSDDGQFLYVALMGTGGVARVNLQLRTVDLRFALGESHPQLGGVVVEDMAVMPGNPQTLVASGRLGQANVGVAVYDDGTERPAIVGPTEFANGYRVSFYDSSTNFYSTFPTGLRRLSITTNGVELVQQFRGNQYGGDMEFAGGLLYSTSGEVFAPAEFRRVGTYPASGLIRPDSSLGRVFFLNQDRLTAFDLYNYREVGVMRLPGVMGSVDSLISCGTNGIAFRTTQGQLFIVRTSLIPDSASADLAVTQVTPVSLATVGSNFTYSITVSNLGPDAATNCVLADRLPLDAVFVSANPSQGSCSFTNGFLACEIGPLAKGDAAQVTLVVRPTVPGELLNTTHVLGGALAVENDIWRQTNAAVFGSVLPAVTQWPIATWDFGYDPAFHRLYLGVQHWNGSLEKSIRSLDLNSGLIASPFRLEAEPGNLVVSRDGRYAYIGVQAGTDVHRIDLQSGSVDQRFEIKDQFGQQHAVLDMQVLPGLSTALAVARAGPQNDVAIYENGIQTRRSQTDLGCRFVEFADSSQFLFGITYGPAPTIYRMEVGASGIALLKAVTGLVNGFDVYLRYGGGFLFASSGEVIEAGSLTRVAALPISGLVEPDTGSSRVFYLTQREADWVLACYDTNTFAPIWNFTIPAVAGTPEKLVACGPGLLAFRTSGGQVFLLNTGLMPGEPTADLSVSLNILTNSVGVGLPMTLFATVTNNGPAAATGVVLTNSLPAGTTLVSTSASQGTCTNLDGTVICDIGELTSAATATVTLTLLPTQGGTLRSTAGVSLVEQDPQRANNVGSATAYLPVLSSEGVRLLEIAAADLVYDRTGGMLYASWPAALGSEANSVVSIEPVTGQLGTPLRVGNGPGKMAVSGDGQFLYVALDLDSAVRRIRLTDQSNSSLFSIGAGLRAADLEVVPGNPAAVAVSRWNPNAGSPRHAGVVIYDDGVPRSQSTSVPVFANAITFSDSATTLYAYDNESSGFAFYVLLVGPNGVSLSKALPDLISGYGVDIEFSGGRVYATTGAVIDPVAGTIVGRFEGPGLGVFAGEGPGTLVEPDIEHGRVYFLVPDGAVWKLKAYDPNSFATLGWLIVPGVVGSPSSLVRAGDETLAFRTSGGQVFLCNRSHVQAADLVLTQAGSANVVTNGAELTYTITVTNRGPGSAANVVLRDTLPADANLISAAVTQGQIETNGAVLACQLGRLPNGGAVTLTVVVTATLPGLAVNQASVTADDFDPEPQDNLDAFLTTVSGPPFSEPVNVLSLPAHDIVFDPARNRILAGLSGGANKVISYDLENREFDQAIQLGDAATKLALSQDARFLYAGLASGAFARIDLTRNLVDFVVAPETHPQLGPFAVFDLQPLDGSPASVAVSTRTAFAGYNPGIAIYDDDLKRTNAIVTESGVSYFYLSSSGSPSNLFAMSPFGVHVVQVDPSGVSFTGQTLNGYAGDFVYEGGWIFTASGKVVDPVTGTLVGTFPVSGLVVPDKSNNRAYFLTQAGDVFTGPLLTLRGFDLSSFSEIWALNIPAGSGAAGSLIRLGTNGLAFHTDANRLFIVRTPLLSAPSADLVVSLSTTRRTVTAGGRFTYTCTIKNEGPWTASNVLLTNPIPSGASVISATSSQGSCTVTNGSVVCGLGRLQNGGSASVTVTVSPTTLGTVNCTAAVTWSGVDPNPANNAASATVDVVPQPAISISGVSVKEGNTLLANVGFALRLSAPSSEPVSVAYASSDGTAMAGSDYDAASGTVTFNPGVTNRTLTIRIRGDVSIEPDETFFVTLSNPTNATLAAAQAVGVIRNDDFHTLSLVGPVLAEGDEGITNAVFEVRLSAPSSQSVTVEFVTTDGSAVSGRDFASKAGTLVFPPGATNKTVAIGVFGNHFQEPDKTFFLVLRNPSGALLGATEAVAAILNDDVEALLELTLVSWGESGLRLSFPATPGRLYGIERSLSLAPASWIQVSPPIVATNRTVEVQDSDAATREAAYYRVGRLD
jgi:uncharacterized repeat protein (TIGR01451 family)